MRGLRATTTSRSSDAQRRKLRTVCDKLELGPDDHVLEIGCGWGSFALARGRRVRRARDRPHDLARRRPSLARERVRRGRARGPRSRSSSRTTGTVDGRVTRRSRRSRCSRRSARSSSDVLRRAATGCSRPADRACIQTILVPDDALRPLPRDAGLDRALRLPRLPDPVARARSGGDGPLDRGSASPRVEEIGPHYAETLRRWRATLPGERRRRCARSATTSASSGRGTSTSPTARRASARGRSRDAQLASEPPGRRRVNLYSMLGAVGFRGLLRALYRIEVSGADRIPARGGVHPRRQPRVARRPVHPRRRDEPADPLHGEDRAVVESASSAS